MYSISTFIPFVEGLIYRAENLSDDYFISSLGFIEKFPIITLHLNQDTELLIIIFSIIMISVFTISLAKLKRQSGYIRYLIGMGFLTSLIFFIILLDKLPHLF